MASISAFQADRGRSSRLSCSNAAHTALNKYGWFWFFYSIMRKYLKIEYLDTLSQAATWSSIQWDSSALSNAMLRIAIVTMQSVRMTSSKNKPLVLWQSEFFLVLQNKNTRAGDQRASFESMKQRDRLCNLSNSMQLRASCQRKIGSTCSAYGTRFESCWGSIPRAEPQPRRHGFW